LLFVSSELTDSNWSGTYALILILTEPLYVNLIEFDRRLIKICFNLFLSDKTSKFSSKLTSLRSYISLP